MVAIRWTAKKSAPRRKVRRADLVPRSLEPVANYGCRFGFSVCSGFFCCGAGSALGCAAGDALLRFSCGCAAGFCSGRLTAGFSVGRPAGFGSGLAAGARFAAGWRASGWRVLGCRASGCGFTAGAGLASGCRFVLRSGGAAGRFGGRSTGAGWFRAAPDRAAPLPTSAGRW